MVMQYIDGGSLLERMREVESGRLDENEAIDIGKQLCTALMVAHDRKIIHRDIKPHNVLLRKEMIPSERWIAKLADFGLARLSDAPQNSNSQAAGTFGYRSPEQRDRRNRKTVDARSDIYSLGATLYHTVSGEAPEGIIDLEGVSDGLRRILRRAMANKPEDRFQTAREFYDELTALGISESKQSVSQDQRSNPLKDALAVVKSTQPTTEAISEEKPSIGSIQTAARPIAPKGELAENPASEFTNSLGMKFRLIPAGRFLMGSPANEKGRYEGELQHEVILTNPFYMGIYPVTQGEYERVMGSNPSRFKGERHPVESVSWDDVMAYIERLNSLAEEVNLGRRYRLPTEAEWEYACRAGSGTAYFFGDEESRLGDYAWYGSNSARRTHPVGQKKPNAWGLHDMHGNVWEWCLDWDGDYPNSAVTDPSGPIDGSRRVFRGGGWGSGAASCRSASRSRDDPSYRYSSLGFRLALSSLGTSPARGAE